VNRVEIRSSGSPHDMTDWCIERTAHVVKYLADAFDSLGLALAVTPSDDLARLEISIRAALRNAVKELAFVCGTSWTEADIVTIANDGRDGYERVAVRFGLMKETRAERRSVEYGLFCARLSDLIAKPTAPNRTVVNAAFSELPTHIRDRQDFRAIREKTDQLLEGICDWTAYRSLVRSILEQRHASRAPKQLHSVPELAVDYINDATKEPIGIHD